MRLLEKTDLINCNCLELLRQPLGHVGLEEGRNVRTIEFLKYCNASSISIIKA